jgi:hypothetical protein
MLNEELMNSKHMVLYVKPVMDLVVDVQDPDVARQRVRAWIANYNAEVDAVRARYAVLRNERALRALYEAEVDDIKLMLEKSGIESATEQEEIIEAIRNTVRVKSAEEIVGAKDFKVVVEGLAKEPNAEALAKLADEDVMRGFVKLGKRLAKKEGPADAALLGQLPEAEARRLQDLQERFPPLVTTQTARQLTRLGLRGAYQTVLDIVAEAIPNAEKTQRLKSLFNDLYVNTKGIKDLQPAISLLLSRDANADFTQKELDIMKKAIKDAADVFAKRIFETTAKEQGIIFMVRVSEGFGRDEVAESLKANEVILPDELRGEIAKIEDVIAEGLDFYYSATLNKYYPIINAIIDVTEGTNMFVTNVGNRALDAIEAYESGATSVIVTGGVVQKLGNAPDGYVGQFYTNLGDKAEEFMNSRIEADGVEYAPHDPELIARHPEKIRDVLAFIAQLRGQRLEDLEEEIVLMKRDREAAFLAELQKLQAEIPGLEITIIEDGTVAHGLKGVMTREQFESIISQKDTGKHKTMITIGGAPEGFMNFVVAVGNKNVGAVGGLRIFSGKMNKNAQGETMKDYSQRYAFTSDEQDEMRELRTDDAEAILKGEKFFNLQDYAGDVRGSFAFITNNGVFRQEGTRQEDSQLITNVLGFLSIQGEPAFSVTINEEFDQALLGVGEAQQVQPIQTQNVGGIDLNPAYLDLQIKRDGNGVPLPVNLQPIENMNINGFYPVIINITPATNLPLLLGLGEERDGKRLSRVN